MSYKIRWGWCRLAEISYLPLHTLNFRTPSENVRTLRRYAWRTFPEGRGSCVRQVISFAMYAFRRLRGSPDRFLNPWENSCRGRWSCRGTVWICAPVSDPRRSCLSRRQLVVSMLFAIFDSEPFLREL